MGEHVFGGKVADDVCLYVCVFVCGRELRKRGDECQTSRL